MNIMLKTINNKISLLVCKTKYLNRQNCKKKKKLEKIKLKNVIFLFKFYTDIIINQSMCNNFYSPTFTKNVAVSSCFIHITFV